ncbi:helix-turn-helix domain-containing protein [Mycobacterium sp. 155]|uniref:helix-turn-helix domain-containing protein n=1 Tax=Mycobacterium sp. 155 TaxID=1157943 RepID=UPI0003676970|nr:helix-turn-helix domain-containing protein [Mycobacterium sp. 155]
MEDTIHGSACALTEPDNSARRHKSLPPALLPYRGCTKSLPRAGTARTAPVWILRAAGHDHRRGPAVDAIRLDLGDMPWAGIPCWRGAQRWVQGTVPVAYAVRYATDVAPLMPGNPIGLKTLVRVAQARADYADHRTGRSCRPTNETLARAAGVSVRTVQRASTALRLLGVATEVLRGRQRTRDERFASWRVGDRGRGWASVWALHDSRFPQLSPHPRSGPVREINSSKKLLTTTNRRSRGGNNAAARRAQTESGARLARQWACAPQSPPWARRYRTTTAWAGVLNGAAQHGWTARDVNQLISDYSAAGNWVPDSPYKPAGLLGHMLRWHDNLDERPAALDEAREAEELAAQRARIARNAAESAAHQRAREQGRAALDGPGHAAARQALAEALQRRRADRQSNGGSSQP